jgi:hypothetical protein
MGMSEVLGTIIAIMLLAAAFNPWAAGKLAGDFVAGYNIGVMESPPVAGSD